MPREVGPTDTYLDRVKKLIPAEVSAGFLAVNSLVPLDDIFGVYVLGFGVIFALFCILYLRILEGVTNVLQLIFVSLIAFPAWAINISVARIGWLQEKIFIAPSILVLVTLTIPLLVDRPKK
jgi:hypothetical protein